MAVTVQRATSRARLRSPAGFTLVELAVAVVILGVLAAFAMPRYATTVERSKASEAFDYLQTVVTAQERSISRMGTYAGDLDDLDVGLEPTEYFSIGKIVVPPGTSSLETGWQLTLKRVGPSGGYGAYTVVYTQEGFDGQTSTIDPRISPLPGATGGPVEQVDAGAGDDSGGGVQCSPPS